MAKKAFTLIEMLAVVSLIAILFIIFIPRIDFATNKTKETGVMVDFRSYQLAFGQAAIMYNSLSIEEEKLISTANKYMDKSLQIKYDKYNDTFNIDATDPWGNKYIFLYDKQNGVCYIVSSGSDGAVDTSIDLISDINSRLGSRQSLLTGDLYYYAYATDNSTKSNYNDDNYALVIKYTNKVISNTIGFDDNISNEIGNLDSTEFEFTIDGKEYQTQSNYTWRQWVSSVYNTDKFSLAGSNIISESGRYIAISSTKVNESDLVYRKDYILIEEGIHHDAAIPQGASYYRGVTSNMPGNYTGGMKLDTYPDTPIIGDVYVYGDYEYRYNQYAESVYKQDYQSEFKGWVTNGSQNGWGVYTLNKTKQVYPEILTSIANKPITSLSSTFLDCSNMNTSPKIPDTVLDMRYTFSYCSSLTDIAIIPSRVTNMQFCFNWCESLKQAPILPDSLINMMATFYCCGELINPPVIPDKVRNMNSTFERCYKLSKAPSIPDSVIYMGYTFINCHEMKTVPIIPENVKYTCSTFHNCYSIEKLPEGFTISIDNDMIRDMFRGCYKLSGVIRIDCNPANKDNVDGGYGTHPYLRFLMDAGRDSVGIVLTGESSMLEDFKSTNSNGKVTIHNICSDKSCSICNGG